MCRCWYTACALSYRHHAQVPLRRRSNFMAQATVAGPPPMTRREFLFYIWGASMLLSLGGATGAILWFAYPRFREGEFGGDFPIAVADLPPVGAPPEDNPAGRLRLVRTDEGLIAIYKVCTHLGCLYSWVPANGRFECPCHGSKFEVTGEYIEGPAPRNLDRFIVRTFDANGNLLTETITGDPNSDPAAGSPVEVPDDAVEIRVATGQRVDGASVS
ncbi:MAG: Rieske 2Fe-2S domain-containing protein [Chloroflexi bacterium]|nr:Rieske 2Fe-2S domain-containing protein [Chloroflexota bacterium]